MFDSYINWTSLRLANTIWLCTLTASTVSFCPLPLFFCGQVNLLYTPCALRSCKCAVWDPASHIRPIKQTFLGGGGPHVSSMRVQFTRRPTSSSQMTASEAVMSCTESLGLLPQNPFQEGGIHIHHCSEWMPESQRGFGSSAASDYI